MCVCVCVCRGGGGGGLSAVACRCPGYILCRDGRLHVCVVCVGGGLAVSGTELGRLLEGVRGKI